MAECLLLGNGDRSGDATAAAADIKSGKTAYVKGSKITGTSKDYGSVSQTLNAGQSYAINAGFYSAGKVSAASLASQTSATATAAQIRLGQTAWVNGSKITGTIYDYEGEVST